VGRGDVVTKVERAVVAVQSEVNDAPNQEARRVACGEGFAQGGRHAEVEGCS